MALARRRNETVEWIKLLAACFVVMIHTAPESMAGNAINCAARFAVPLFFMISGYFSLDSHCKTLKRRAFHIFKMLAALWVLYLAWECWRCHVTVGQSVADTLGDYLTWTQLINLLFFSYVPAGYHLWFLMALLCCYLALWLYTRFWEEEEKVPYQALFMAGFFLCALHFCFSPIGRINDIHLGRSTYRNFLFMGLPTFILGLFLHAYQDRIRRSFEWNGKKALLLVLLGNALAFLQWFCYGKAEMPIGSLLAAMTLLFWGVTTPNLLPDRPVWHLLSSTAGKLSIWIYGIHVMVKEWIEAYAGKSAVLQSMVAHPMRFPFYVLICSFCVSLLCLLVCNGVKWAVSREKTTV